MKTVFVVICDEDSSIVGIYSKYKSAEAAMHDLYCGMLENDDITEEDYDGTYLIEEHDLYA